MELLTSVAEMMERIFFTGLMYLKVVVFSRAEEGIKAEDASYTFVSVKFSRSFV